MAFVHNLKQSSLKYIEGTMVWYFEADTDSLC